MQFLTFIFPFLLCSLHFRGIYAGSVIPAENTVPGLTECDEDGEVPYSTPAALFDSEPIQFSLVETRDMETAFRLQMRTFERDFNLSLRRRSGPSVFADGFKIQDRVASKAELDAIERNIFVDSDSKAVLYLSLGEESNEYEMVSTKNH